MLNILGVWYILWLSAKCWVSVYGYRLQDSAILIRIWHKFCFPNWCRCLTWITMCIYIYRIYSIYISNVYIYIYMCVLFHVYYQFLSTTCSFLGGDGEHVDHDPWLSMKFWKVKIHLDQWRHGIFKNSLSLTLSGTRLHPNRTLFSVFCFGGVRLTYCSFKSTFILRTLMTFCVVKKLTPKRCFT